MKRLQVYVISKKSTIVLGEYEKKNIADFQIYRNDKIISQKLQFYSVLNMDQKFVQFVIDCNVTLETWDQKHHHYK